MAETNVTSVIELPDTTPYIRNFIEWFNINTGINNSYISAILMLIGFFFLSKAVVWIIEKIVLKLTAKTETTLDDEIVGALKWPMSWILLCIGVELFIVTLWDGYFFENLIRNFLLSCIVFVITSATSKVIGIIIMHAKDRSSAKKYIEDQLLIMFKRIVSILIYIVGFLIILVIWGVNVSPVLAGLGIGGLAVALALQPTLANIFGGMALILDKTIKVGDIIKLDSGESGTIYDIGLRSTRVRTYANELVIIPNGVMVNSRITNLAKPDPSIRVEIEFGVAYGSKVDKVKQIALAALKGEKHIVDDPAPVCLFVKMAESSLNFKLMFHINDLTHRGDIYQTVIEKLYNSLNDHKIAIPFPQSEVWMHNAK